MKHLSQPNGSAAGLTLLLLLLCGAGPASTPASQPAADIRSMSADQIHFASPSPPWALIPVDQDNVVLYLSPDHKSEFQAQYLPGDFQIAPDQAGAVAAQIVQTLKKRHQEKKDSMDQQPKILRDSRFDVVIRERIKIGDAVQDQMHIYRSVGPRVMLMVVSCTDSDKDVIAATDKAAEDMLASCKFNRKAFKKGK